MTTVEPEDARISIRPAERADLLAVHRLERDCFPSPWPYQAFLSHLDAPAFLLARSERDLAGYLVGDTFDGFPGRVGHVKDLAVAPSYRRRGIGSRLLREGVRRLAAAGVVRIRLEVRRTNGAARGLYETMGFAERRIESGYYDDGTDAVIMTYVVGDGSVSV